MDGRTEGRKEGGREGELKKQYEVDLHGSIKEWTGRGREGDERKDGT